MLGRLVRPTSRVAARARIFSSSSSAADDASQPSTSTQEDTGIPKIVVLGGRGFVGSHVCQEALSTGLPVLGLSRSGTPPLSRDPWVQQVEWARGDALDPQTYAHYLRGAAAVISCVGAFGNQQQMRQINGTANVRAVETAKAAGVPRFVFISANIPNIPGLGALLGGYIQGKADAEAALAAAYPEGGVFLRPGVIYGNRAVSQNITLPLQYVFQPLEFVVGKVPNARALASLPLVGAAFVPPVSAAAVARAAVRAATDPSVPAGPMEVWDIQGYA